MKARRTPQKQRTRQTNRLRIIAGKWRSRQLDFPPEEGLRPTGDRTRETLFNWLAPHLPGSRCLDAFAGSGALGFEALSRGAAEVVFLEKNAEAHSYLLKNCQQLEAEGAQIIHTDALAWMSGQHTRCFDIIFIDPPFSANLQSRCLDLISQSGLCNEETLVYIESPAEAPLPASAPWNTVREKQAGAVTYRLLSPC